MGPSWVQVSRIRARPPQPAIAAGSSGSWRHCWIDSATRPPAASSHARVGSEKNAHGGEVRVHSTAVANEAAATNAEDHRVGRRLCRGAAPEASDEPRGTDDQHRPHQVELLLDAQRPVVLERRGQVGGQVVGALDGEPVVADVQRAGDAVA